LLGSSQEVGRASPSPASNALCSSPGERQIEALRAVSSILARGTNFFRKKSADPLDTHRDFCYYIRMMQRGATMNMVIKFDDDCHNFKIPENLVDRFDYLMEKVVRAKPRTEARYDAESVFNNEFFDFMEG
jgi:hypothetical protein